MNLRNQIKIINLAKIYGCSPEHIKEYRSQIREILCTKKDATDTEIEQSIKEHIHQFRFKLYDPSYYAGDGESLDEGDWAYANDGLSEFYGADYSESGGYPLRKNTKKCICDIKLLMDVGCGCGGFEAEQKVKGERK